MEMRKDRRIEVQAQGFFLLDGMASQIKVMDTNLRGIGAYAANELKPGQQGVLIARLPNFPEGEGLTSEVCWCLRGLAILGGSDFHHSFLIRSDPHVALQWSFRAGVPKCSVNYAVLSSKFQ